MINTKRFKILIMSFIALFTLLPAQAFAYNLFDEFQSDYLVTNTLRMIFGGDGKQLTSNSLLTTANTVFVTACLVIAGVLAMYTMLAGSLQTANDGQMLGKKWSSMWVPLKTSLGVAMMLPAFNGWAGAQVVLYWVALQGIWLADATWAAFVNGSNMNQNGVYTNRSVVYQVQPLLDQMIELNVKTIASQRVYEKVENEKKSGSYFMTNSNKPPKFGYSKTSNGNSLVIEYGDQNKVFGSSSLFGQLTYNMTTRDAAANLSMQYSNSLLNMKTMEQEFSILHSAQAISLNDKAYKIATKIMDGNLTSAEMTSLYYEALKTYSDNLNKEGKVIFEKASKNDTKLTMMQDGWVVAWAWFVPISIAQSTMQTSLDNIPVIEQNKLSNAMESKFNNDTLGEVNQYADTAKTYIQEARKSTAKNPDNTYGAIVKSGSTDDSSWGMLINSIMNGNNKTYQSSFNATLFDLSLTGTSFVTPIVKLMSFGDALIDIVNAALIALTTGSIISAVPFFGNAVVAAYALIAPIFAIIISGLLVPAIVLKFVIPMMPLMIGMGIILSYLMQLCKSMFGVMLWMVSFLSPDQDGFVGKQGQGYMLILQLLLKPCLSILGFISSLAIMVPACTLFGALFEIAMPASQSGFRGLLQLIAMSLIYMIVHFNIFKEVLSISHTLPDEIFTWIGGHSNNEMGKYSAGMESASRQAAGGMVATGVGGSKAMTGGLINGVNSLGRRYEQKRRDDAAGKEEHQRNSPSIEITKK
ncbi:DotA/TraY family protein [Buttiauxella gaviniae]|uniref:DotA/TraY family protein n=1 Tax=Buttiauxella gaviniae TaxID=82990 RepID=UPI0039AEF212